MTAAQKRCLFILLVLIMLNDNDYYFDDLPFQLMSFVYFNTCLCNVWKWKLDLDHRHQVVKMCVSSVTLRIDLSV